MEEEIIFYFVYSNNDEYKHHLDILIGVFGDKILDNIKDDNSEKIVSIRLDKFDSDNLFDLLAEYDENELRMLRIADDLIIGLHSHLQKVVYKENI
ncbi:TPA: hypothetical protein KO123_002310 [Clostridioides difficile]|uniref:hypothetical protein n=1 Tax=Clostridioides difficile TaxID=1496 RepID=UPI000B3C989C|nr:hypothetical protein [Clostridioides difficile]MCJ0089205.1 hypothetical protein [Clostridioides difficile]MCJ0314065.1 hypothetical protein [Clostridioides difficile]MDB3148231.1 hypothetical protein [Clostridioides difficile]MDB3182430.1 hypothetical protein [Clostridioides difficile]MDB3201442.1 hypothetical protein [Clostridioides difficile]